MRLEHSLEIHAPAELVWGVTVDVEHWSDWNPNITSIERLEAGPIGLGSTARIRQPQLPPAVWRVTTFAPPRHFVWETQMRGMRFVVAHEIIPTAHGCTSRLTLEISGLMVPLLSPLMRGSATKAIETENRGLRDWCQRKAQSGAARA